MQNVIKFVKIQLVFHFLQICDIVKINLTFHFSDVSNGIDFLIEPQNKLNSIEFQGIINSKFKKKGGILMANLVGKEKSDHSALAIEFTDFIFTTSYLLLNTSAEHILFK